MHETKTELRHVYRARRNAFSGEEREAAQNAIVQNLARVLADEKRARIATYLAVRGEANIDELLRVLARRSAVVAAPASYDLPPLFGRLRTTRQVVTDERGARFPPETSRSISPPAFDAILVPGVAFDESGNRLGQGGGWYDRMLTESAHVLYDRVLADAPHVLKIGVAFDCQIAEQLPHESHDIPMDFVVTQTRCINVREECSAKSGRENIAK